MKSLFEFLRIVLDEFGSKYTKKCQSKKNCLEKCENEVEIIKCKRKFSKNRLEIDQNGPTEIHKRKSLKKICPMCPQKAKKSRPKKA